ncbi:MAG: GNAT family N-acetyltransferase [Proteobacteria bacterium]|nr:GNAT family N-acetyltransferase [Pseudomonadota bacterium]
MRLRMVAPEDAEAILEHTRVLTEDGRGMVFGLDELPSVDEVRSRIEKFLSDADCYLVAHDDDGLIGTIDIARIQRRRLVHNGMLTMGVHPRAQGQGVGRALVEAALAWAEVNGVERVELYTLDSNVRAQKLYESVGFRLAWRRDAFHRRPDGTLEADLVMEWRAGVPGS